MGFHLQILCSHPRQRMLPQGCIQLLQQNIREVRLASFQTYEIVWMNLPFFVGFDIAKIAGRVEVEHLRASNTWLHEVMVSFQSIKTGNIRIKLWIKINTDNSKKSPIFLSSQHERAQLDAKGFIPRCQNQPVHFA